MENNRHSEFLFKQASRESIALRIRQLRKARGWTLADAQVKSKGSLKAVVLGSYERGDRSMSVERAIQIADLFGIPLYELLTDSPPRTAGAAVNSTIPSKIVIDLRRAKNADFAELALAQQLSLFVAWIIGLRQDWNGELLSLRGGDLELLALMMFKSPESVIDWMQRYDVLMSVRA